MMVLPFELEERFDGGLPCCGPGELERREGHIGVGPSFVPIRDIDDPVFDRGRIDAGRRL